MLEFCDLYWRLDSTTKTTDKIDFLADYFSQAAPADAAWATYFLTGRRIPRLVGTKLLRKWARELAGVEEWLFDECYDHVGDLAETIALILPPRDSGSDFTLQELVERELIPLGQMEVHTQRQKVVELWSGLTTRQVFVLGKLLMGAFRIGVSAKLVYRALSKAYHIEASALAHRLMGDWTPSSEFFCELVDPDSVDEMSSKPYPFFLANPLKDERLDTLGLPSEWIAEWKWDGIRAQVIRRQGETFIWTRGEELATLQFPEIADAAAELPEGLVLDGEILAWNQRENLPLDFNCLQRRLGRKKVGAKIRKDFPVRFLAFDLLEFDHQDLRQTPLFQRHKTLRGVVSGLRSSGQPIQAEFDFDGEVERLSTAVIEVSSPLKFETWECLSELRSESKQKRVEGLMLKKRSSTYQVGRPVGDWWKWKVDPFTIDAVLIYAQRGHGRRASLYTDFTFAVWKDGELVPFAKAYSGLTDEELVEVDRFVRQHTHEKFGPVRSVTPQLVFELAFENIQRSSRHKSGIAVRFPRINRWRHDKQPQDADHLDSILEMIDS